MAKNSSFILTPVEENSFSGSFKGSAGVFNGEDASPFSEYKRTGGSEVPEKTFDTISGAGKGSPDLAFADKLPHNLQ